MSKKPKAKPAEPTKAEVEAAAKAIADLPEKVWFWLVNKWYYRKHARAALRAAARVRSQRSER